MGLADTAKLIAELGLVDKLSPGLKTAGGNVTKFERGLGRAQKGVGQLSGGMARAGTVIAGAAVTGLGAAAAAAIQWEDAFTGVEKTVDESTLAKGTTFRDLELALRNLSTEMPNTAIELAQIAEAGGQMGIAGADIEAFTRQVAILASTTNVGAEDAAMALGQLKNVIGLTGDEFDNFAAALVDLGNAGSSTESAILEVTRRAGGAAKLAGIAKDETLGWAAAAANLGLNEELAGTALQNFFVKTTSLVAGGGKRLRDFAKISGMSAKEFKRAFRKDASGALEDFLGGLSGLSKGQRIKTIQKFFGKGSGLTRLLIGLSDSMDKNLTPSLDQSAKAWEDATAAQEEFDKRNATVRSAIARLRNGVFDAAVTVGEGFTPALGRAADKLGEFLKSGENRQALTNLGQDIGKAIDGIDWKEVLRGARDFVDVMKVALGFAKNIFDTLNALPTEIKGAAAGLLVLNKASGGLIGAGLGNIVGGLGESIVRGLGSQLPGVGRAFAQPVFVTNWPIGGMGGAAGAAGAAGGVAGKVGKVVGAVAIVGSALAVFEQQQQESAKNTAASQAIRDRLTTMLGTNPTKAQMETALGAVEQGIRDITANPLHTLVQGDALTNLQAMRDALKTQITGIDNLKDQSDRTKDDTVNATTKVQQKVNETKRETSRGLSQVKASAQRGLEQTRSAAQRAGQVGAAATRTGSAQIVGAINRIPAPITNVRVYVTAGSVTRTVSKSDRVSSRPSQGSGPTSASGV